VDRGDGRRDELAAPQIFHSDLGHPLLAASVRATAGGRVTLSASPFITGVFYFD
jgi:hypothetical protein